MAARMSQFVGFLNGCPAGLGNGDKKRPFRACRMPVDAQNGSSTRLESGAVQ
jgi:hypothetical protein